MKNLLMGLAAGSSLLVCIADAFGTGIAIYDLDSH